MILTWIQSAAAVVFTFGLVIFLHELGHFILCRWFKVRVERFAFGFGPELVGISHEGTRYSICAFPLGGFVKPAGDNLEDCTGEASEYFSKSWTQRLAIVAAGPAMNYLLAFTLFFLVISVRGIPEPSKGAVIGETVTDYPAEVAGLKTDDRVTRAGSIEISSWAQFADLIHSNPNRTINLAFVRDGVTMHATVIPRLDPASGYGQIGVLSRIDYRPAGIFEAARESAHQCWLWTAYTVKTLAQKIYRRERPDLAGPVGIVQMVHRAARSGLEDLIFLIGLISVAVGFFNLLPIPLLDGGHAALYVWEGISRRKLTLKAMTAANSVGMAFLLSLLLFATYNDFVRIRAERREQQAAHRTLMPSPGAAGHP